MTAAPTGPDPRTDAADEIRQSPPLAAYQRAQRIIADWTDEDWADYADLARRFAHALAESCDTCRHHDPRTDAAVAR